MVDFLSPILTSMSGFRRRCAGQAESVVASDDVVEALDDDAVTMQTSGTEPRPKGQAPVYKIPANDGTSAQPVIGPAQRPAPMGRMQSQYSRRIRRLPARDGLRIRGVRL